MFSLISRREFVSIKIKQISLISKVLSFLSYVVRFDIIQHKLMNINLN